MNAFMVLAALIACYCVPVLAAPELHPITVDANGVLQFADGAGEVALFGVNYYPPFSIDYAEMKAKGFDHEQAIRDDVKHFARLGLTAIRLHCWDREISDHQGNLIENDHLRLLDLLISECANAGIYTVLTPIAWWNSPTGGGFSDLYTMHQMTTDPAAREVQCNYLRQFVNHVNQFRKRPYRDDPAVAGFETINEPIYPPGTTDGQVVEYINALVDAIKSTGCRKPVFHSFFCSRETAVGASNADGITFGWYPTGLVAGQMLTGDYLPIVNDYAPMRNPALDGKAKIVYEFDAADVHKPYVYPAMARAFRSGGGQIATQFQYDPMCLAAWNKNWQTHYLNLCYTPGKAISFAIAAEAFRRIPRLSRFGDYPASNRFGDFRVSYEEELGELVSEDSFMYSNDTSSVPPAPEKLQRVWGCGSSPVVSYSGTGAYFLDREDRSYWRLQVYPDAVMVADPYSGGGNEKTRILWQEREMTVRIPELGGEFQVTSVEGGAMQTARESAFKITPGEYVLSRGTAEIHTGARGDFLAPPSSDLPPAAFVESAKQWREGYPWNVRASVAGADIRRCNLRLKGPGDQAFSAVPMQEGKAYQFAALVPGESVRGGKTEYYLEVETGDGIWTFPGGKPGARVDEAGVQPAALMQVARDSTVPQVSYSGPEGKSARASFVPGPTDDSTALRIEADAFAEPPSCAGIRWPVTAPGNPAAYDAVAFIARGGPDTTAAEITLVQDDGNAFGYNVPLGEDWGETVVALEKLKPMWSTTSGAPDLSQLKEVSVIFGTWLFPHAKDLPHWVEVERIELRKASPTWTLDVDGRTDPILLVRPADRHVHLWGTGRSGSSVPGMDRGVNAFRVDVDGFKPEPDCVSYRLPVQDAFSLWQDEAAQTDCVILKARAGRPNSDSVELVVIEKDGAPWGTEVKLDHRWQAIKIPFSELRYFGHWNPDAPGRGGEGDRLRPENVRSVNVCFGAFLYPEHYDERHAVEIQDASLGWLGER